MRKLFEHRQTADYDCEKTLIAKTAEEDIEAARAIVEARRSLVEAAIAQA